MNVRKKHRHENATQGELFSILTAKNPAILTLTKKLGLELIDEDTGEYLNTSDLLQLKYKHATLPYNPNEKRLDIDYYLNNEFKDKPMSDNKKWGSGKQSTTEQKPEPQKTVIYPEGILILSASDKAPEFILGDLIISPQGLIDWMNKNEALAQIHEKYGAQFRFTVKRGKNGKLYLAVSDYKPKGD